MLLGLPPLQVVYKINIGASRTERERLTFMAFGLVAASSLALLRS